VDAPNPPPPHDVAAAAAALAAGRLVVFPTETFYGIAARALLPEAVRAVAALKERGGPERGRVAKPISVVVADRAMAECVVARIPAAAEPLIARFWPGPLTLVLPARNDLPPELTAASGRIGVRVSSHPIARALAAAVGEPITATSANRAGEPPACDVASARAALGDAVALYLDGGVLAGGLGSSVLLVDDDGARVVRAGAVAVDALRAALGDFPLTIGS